MLGEEMADRPTGTVIFMAPVEARVIEVIFLLLCALSVLGSVLVVGVIARFSEIPVACAGAIGLFSCILAGKWARGHLQFSLSIDPPEIHIGRGIFRDTIACKDVERIRAFQTKYRRTAGLEVMAHGRRWRLGLGNETLHCIDALRRACPRAHYFDHDGILHPFSHARAPGVSSGPAPDASAGHGSTGPLRSSTPPPRPAR